MIPLTYILINFIQAIWHAFLIGQNKLIQSKQKIIEYGVLSLLAGATILILSGGQVVPLIIFCILARLAFFDPFLNVLRGKPISYEGEIKKKKSLYDWIENKIGLPVWFYRILYLAAFIAYLLIYYL